MFSVEYCPIGCDTKAAISINVAVSLEIKVKSIVDCSTQMSAEVGSEGEKRIRVQVPELLCKNGCGYYGTPQWKGLCSQCWRVYQMQEKRKQDYAKNRCVSFNVIF